MQFEKRALLSPKDSVKFGVSGGDLVLLDATP